MPTIVPTVTSVETTEGVTAVRQSTDEEEDQPAVTHALVSDRALEEKSCCPKFSPPTVTEPVIVRAKLLIPRKLTEGAGRGEGRGSGKRCRGRNGGARPTVERKAVRARADDGAGGDDEVLQRAILDVLGADAGDEGAGKPRRRGAVHHAERHSRRAVVRAEVDAGDGDHAAVCRRGVLGPEEADRRGCEEGRMRFETWAGRGKLQPGRARRRK